jgi:ubiquinone/menaquinone biosynthesis C-methylase UbiE
MSEIYYSRQKPGNWLDSLSLKKRMEMLNIFFSEFPGSSISSVLDVGVTSDKKALASNYFEKHYPVKSKITALSNQDASFLEEVYPGLKFQLGDARQLPFNDQSMDVIFSSAVIEHIGSYENQKTMLQECYRVAKHGIFITTPNRWYPIELHTILPLLHWLPKFIHRKILKLLGLSFYAREENLNLLDRWQLEKMCHELGIKNFVIKSISTFGFTSNLILIATK